MKSKYLFIFYIINIFVIISKASVRKDFEDEQPVVGNKYKIWVREIGGYDSNDPFDGFAGIFGEPITNLRVNGGQEYTVHLLNENKWMLKVNGSDINNIYGYAGRENGSPIDAIAIAEDVQFMVHTLGEDWSLPVKGDPNDLVDLPFINENGKENNLVNFNPKHYAGTIGKPIDAIMIKDRKYATSFNTETKCSARGGNCMNPDNCKGAIKVGLCPGSNNNRCCLLNLEENYPNINDTISNDESNIKINDTSSNIKETNSDNSFKPYIIIIVIISIIAVIALIMYLYDKYSKKWMKNQIKEINDDNDFDNSNNSNHSKSGIINANDKDNSHNDSKYVLPSFEKVMDNIINKRS